LAILAGFEADVAVAALAAFVDLIVLALDRPPEEGPTTGADLAAVIAVLPGFLGANVTQALLLGLGQAVGPDGQAR
jgi:hypothetical protein